MRKASIFSLAGPRTWSGSRQAHRDGFRVHRSGKRVTQLGATFVIGPGSHVRYEHVDAHSSEHAPLDEVLAALPPSELIAPGAAVSPADGGRAGLT